MTTDPIAARMLRNRNLFSKARARIMEILTEAHAEWTGGHNVLCKLDDEGLIDYGAIDVDRYLPQTRHLSALHSAYADASIGLSRAITAHNRAKDAAADAANRAARQRGHEARCYYVRFGGSPTLDCTCDAWGHDAPEPDDHQAWLAADAVEDLRAGEAS